MNETITKIYIQKLIKEKSDRLEYREKDTEKSKFWDSFYNIYLDGSKTNFSSCKTCKDLIVTYSKGKSNGTNRLAKHKCSKNSVHQPSIENMLMKTPSKKDIDEVNDIIVLSLCKDLRPFKMTSYQGFHDITNAFLKLGRKYGPIDSKKLIKDPSNLKKTHIVNIYDDYKNIIMKEFEKCHNFSFTTDLWKDSLTCNNYLSLTCQFVNSNSSISNVCLATILSSEKRKSNLKACLNEALEKLFVNAVSLLTHCYFVTENGSNVRNLFDNWLPCVCYNINLVLSHAFKEERLIDFPTVSLLISSSKKLVEYFKRSGKSINLSSLNA
jgi:hypothetical protein